MAGLRRFGRFAGARSTRPRPWDPPLQVGATATSCDVVDLVVAAALLGLILGAGVLAWLDARAIGRVTSEAAEDGLEE